MSSPARPAGGYDEAVRAADEWQARERDAAAGLQGVRQRAAADKDTLEATRRRIDAEANARKHAILRVEADAEAARLAREKLDAAREAADAHRARQMAEAEAESLVKIKIATERQLLAQEQARAEAERAAELAAIARMQADNEAAQLLRQREAAEAIAGEHARARTEAERAAEAAAAEHRAVRERFDAERQGRRQTELAAAKARRSRWGIAWTSLRYASPPAVGAAALALGALFGAGFVAVQGYGLSQSPVLKDDGRGPELRLRLDYQVRVAAPAATGKVVDLPSPVR